MRRLLGYFARGLVLLAPLAVTVWVCWIVFKSVDGWLGLPIPGAGFVATLALITLFGFLGSNLLTRSAVSALEAVMARLPFVRLLYGSTKDLLNAFVGEKRRFDKPVIMSLTADHSVRLMGFVTQEVSRTLASTDRWPCTAPTRTIFRASCTWCTHHRCNRSMWPALTPWRSWCRAVWPDFPLLRSQPANTPQPPAPSLMLRMRLSSALAVAAATVLTSITTRAHAQGTTAAVKADIPVLLVPDAVFDGTTDAPHKGWAVLVNGQRITAAGPLSSMQVPAGARQVALPGTTLIPGLSDLHSHVLLHPYDETPWNDQVLRESLALRTARAVNHLKATLDAGFTMLRDLGTEGADYADVGLKEAVDQGIIRARACL